ncbi:MAG: Uma2 family endonuclease [Gemmataceae bacterium]
MSAIPKRKLTEAEYLEIERAAEFKSEYYDGVMYPMQGPAGVVGMAGATVDHNKIKENVSFELNTRLRGGPCEALSRDMRVKVLATGLHTYPDVVVYCGTPEFHDDEKRDTLLNPTVVVEVLSESTEKYDRTTKMKHYRRIPSLREYVMISQDHVSVERYARQANGQWLLTEYDDPAGALDLECVSVEIPLAAIYRGVRLPENPPLR